MPPLMVCRTSACSTQAQTPGPVFYWKQVPGQVVFGVVLLCIVLLLLQRAALKKKTSE